MRADDALLLIRDELRKATNKFGAMGSPHEGVAVIREEYLELEREVFHGDHQNAIEEAIQLGAMAARFIVDMTPTPEPPDA